MHTAQTFTTRDEFIVAKALFNASRHLEIKNVELSKILGISESQLSKINNEKASLDKNSKEFELALLFIRIFRSLDTLIAGDKNAATTWIRSHNRAINGTPLEHMKKIDGLVNVLSYLDSRRARV